MICSIDFCKKALNFSYSKLLKNKIKNKAKINRKEIIIPESKFEESRLIFFDKWQDPKKNIVTNEVIK